MPKQAPSRTKPVKSVRALSGTVFITRFDNLSIYYQDGKRRRVEDIVRKAADTASRQ